MEKKQVDLTRRKFLSGAKVLGALGAAALVGTQLEVEAAVIEEAAVDNMAETNSYHETEHIRRYYETVRF